MYVDCERMGVGVGVLITHVAAMCDCGLCCL